MTSLLDRDITPEDLEAERDVPRPGVWAGQLGADLRSLTQDETDALIRAELVQCSIATGETDEIRRVVGGTVRYVRFQDHASTAGCQRGGIDSDPLVRVLARRAWGDRDRTWFDLRGVRKGDPVSEDGTRVARTRPGERVIGKALTDAQTGAEVLIGALDDPSRFRISRVSDRLREPVRTCTTHVDENGYRHTLHAHPADGRRCTPVAIADPSPSHCTAYVDEDGYPRMR